VLDNAIHVVSTCSSDCLALTLLREIFSELPICKYTVVQLVFLDGAIIMVTVLFVALFTLKCFNGIGCLLKMGKDTMGCDINKEGAGAVLPLRSVSSHSIL